MPLDLSQLMVRSKSVYVRMNMSIILSFCKTTVIKFILGKELSNSTLKLVQIYFDTATFDNIDQDKQIKTEAQLSLIGGTMGLLTGFSIISGVEIVFFLFRLIANIGNVGNSIFRLICSLRISGLLWQKLKDYCKTIDCKLFTK